MGFSFKKVFKKSEDRGTRVVFGNEPDPEPQAEEEPSVDQSDTEIPSLPPPPLDGRGASPFHGDGISPFEGDRLDGEGLLTADGFAAPTTEPDRQGSAHRAQLSPFDQADGAPIDAIGQRSNIPMDPAAVPLPKSHDSDSARELEGKGFRPLSSMSNQGLAQVATPSMEEPPNDPPSRHPQDPAGGQPNSPFEVAGPRGTPYTGQPAEESPFEIAPDGDPLAVPPGASMTGMGAFVQPQQPSGDDLPPGAFDDPREFVEMNVVQLLESLNPADLGVEELTVSPFAKTRIPMAMLKPQLPTGQVFLNVSDIIVGCKREIRGGMRGFDPTVRLKVPIRLIFPPDGAPAIAQAPVGPDQFEQRSMTPPIASSAPGLFGALPGAPSQPAPPPQTAADNSPEPEPTEMSEMSEMPEMPEMPENEGHDGEDLALLGIDSGSLQPDQEPAVEPSNESSPPAAALEMPGAFGSPLAALPPLGGSPPTADLSAAPPLEDSETESKFGSATQSVVPPESTLPLPPLMPAGNGLAPTEFDAPDDPPIDSDEPTEPTEPSEPSGVGGWPFDKTENALPPSAEEVIELLEDLPPLDAEGDCVVPLGFDAPDEVPDDGQLALRGIFLTGDMVDADRLAAYCAELPGIEDCIVLGRESLLCGSSPDSEAFADEASRLHVCLIELTSAVGLAESDCLTLRTDGAMVSFFAGDGLAIGVRHGLKGFRPGVRERLSIVARELGNLASQS